MVIELDLTKVAICIFMIVNMLTAYSVYDFNKYNYELKPFLLLLAILVCLALGTFLLIAVGLHEVWERIKE